jgi:hypothetical protein
MAAANNNEVKVAIPAARVAVIGCGWWAQGEQCYLLPSSSFTRVTYGFLSPNLTNSPPRVITYCRVAPTAPRGEFASRRNCSRRRSGAETRLYTLVFPPPFPRRALKEISLSMLHFSIRNVGRCWPHVGWCHHRYVSCIAF